MAKIFHLGYLLLLDRLDRPDAEFGTVAARTLQRAKAAGCRTSVDMVSEDSQRFAEIALPALRFVDYCFLNEFEIERTTGIQIRQTKGIDLAALRKAAQKLIEAGVREWVIVHFPEGTCALGRKGQFHLQVSLNIPQSQIVSTVGAGDAFAAGVLYGLHEGIPMEKSLRYGVCAATSCLCGSGTSDAIRPLKECIELEKEFGISMLGKNCRHQFQNIEKICSNTKNR